MSIKIQVPDTAIHETIALLESFGSSFNDIEVSIHNQPEAALTVTCADGKAHIIYGRRVELFRGLGIVYQNRSIPIYSIEQPSVFRYNGAMLDCSRNAVLKKESVSRMIQHMALMGLDTLMLYTEDTYSLPEYPYFGYMRGRYSQEECMSMDIYAAQYGIELVPCIQTLAHLGCALGWPVFAEVLDVNDILLADEEKTYSLIDAMLCSCRKSYRTRRIHIGMDEAHMLGLGRYLEKHGEQPRFEILCRHLNHVSELCKKYDFTPMMWSDMFYRLMPGGDYDNYSNEGLDPEHIALIPSDVGLVYWDYYQDDGGVYDTNLTHHRNLPNNILFAGGAWRWMGYAPSIGKSLDRSRLALDACTKHGIEEVFVTAWGDNGSDSSMFTILPVLQLYAEYGYGNADITEEALAERLAACTGESLSNMLLLDLPNEPDGRQKAPHINPNKYLLFQDPLCGLFDRHVGEGYAKAYGEYALKLCEAGKGSGDFAYLYRTMESLCTVLSLKCDLGVRLRKAYMDDDRRALQTMADIDIPAAIKAAEHFHSMLEAQWFHENKAFGYEVQDIRISGVQTRLKSAGRRVLQYVNGELEFLEELEESRLYVDGYADECGVRDDLDISCNLWHSIASACIIGKMNP